MKNRFDLFSFWSLFLGCNFLRMRDGAVFTKGQFLELGPSDDLFTVVDYEPAGGWETDNNKEIHFANVERFKLETGTPPLSSILAGKIRYTPTWETVHVAHRKPQIFTQEIETEEILELNL